MLKDQDLAEAREMQIDQIGSYDGLPTFRVRAGLSEVKKLREGLPQGLSIGWFFGADANAPMSLIHESTLAVASTAPVFIHLFGRLSETVHDALDKALVERPSCIVVPTVWSMEYRAEEAIFDLFRVDFPSEDCVEKWSGRLLLFDASVSREEEEKVAGFARDPDAAIRLFLASD